MIDTIDLDALTDDGEIVELPDGRTLRLRIEPDDLDPFVEYDCYGTIAPVERRLSRAERPAGFDGNAEKLWASRSDQVWWQPPADLPFGRETGEFRRFRGQVLELLEMGMYSFGLELLDGTDAYGRPIVVATAWLGGVEPFADNGWRREILSDLAAELALDVEVV